MGILGLTHDENGEALEKLPVTIKVAIGRGRRPMIKNSSLRALFHFVFKRKPCRGIVFWEPAPDIAEVFGEKPTELAVIFLHDDPERYAHREYALWTRKAVYVTRACADRQRQHAALRNAGNPKTTEHRRGNHGRVITKYVDGR